eukprot:CAMPEP_0194282728 /NCGR_PEP_ID=MMETSP0169-20130528/23736_1 /TAXON_ID=218684 /ORGANISM="Corethron pennatum, Strain L29A3" /LENGTH=62 /DNA_ID=CAMNT_0039028131 /DNA_START=36 /DNA_END=221 /DNA_ORIENTATION=-
MTRPLFQPPVCAAAFNRRPSSRALAARLPLLLLLFCRPAASLLSIRSGWSSAGTASRPSSLH